MNDMWIEAFLMVIKTGSITKAAEELYVSQSALTQRIMALEKYLGVPIFVRNKGIRNVKLTQYGMKFKDAAKKWDKLKDEINEIKNMKTAPEIRVAAVDSINTYMLQPVYHDFMNKNPEINLIIRTLHSYQAYRAVENGEIDIALVANTFFSDKVLTKEVGSEKYYIVCHKDVELPEEVSPRELPCEKEIFLEWNREFIGWHKYWYGDNLNPKVLVDNMKVASGFLSPNGEWFVAPESMADALMGQNNIKVCRLIHGPEERKIYLLRSYEENEWVKRLENAILEQILIH